MTDFNNMYTGGQPAPRDWETWLRRLRTKIGRAIMRDTPPLPHGACVDLPVRHREFRPDMTGKMLKPIDFSHLRDAPLSDVKAAIAWVEEKAGWFHSVDLKHGIATPGGRGWEERRELFRIPDAVRGKTVLDIGAMEGGDTFCAEDAGAASVTALDVDNYFDYDSGLNAAWDYTVDRYLQAKQEGPESEWVFLNSKRFGFELCRQVRHSHAERISGAVYDLSPSKHGMFDIVYCFGLLYHLRNPLLALDRIAAVTKDRLFICSQIFNGYAPYANTMLYYNDTWRGSYTNWFVPTPQALIDMAGSSGFKRIEVIASTDTQTYLACYK